MIISVSGIIGSGKDTVASYLVDEHGFKRMSWAASLKDAVAAVFGWDRTMLDGTSKNSREWREQVDQWWANRLDMPGLTPRWVLQFWGTNVLRNHFSDSIWVASLENQLIRTTDNIVITDTRFQNEIESVNRVGGTTVRVIRGQDPEWFTAAADYNRGPTHVGWSIGKAKLDKLGIHSSEYSHVGLTYDYTIENNSTIDALNEQINQLLGHQSST